MMTNATFNSPSIQDKVNARFRIIEGNLTPEEAIEISAKIEGDIPSPLSENARAEFMKTLPLISLSSDAFFPYARSQQFF
jgi:hypothetical protein